VKPRHRRVLARWVQAAYQASERRVSRLVLIQRSTLRYQGHRDRQEALRMRLRELAANRVRFGYRRLTVLLKREGWRVNAKRIYHLYTEEGLTVRTKYRHFGDFYTGADSSTADGLHPLKHAFVS
jgi:putative transposase